MKNDNKEIEQSAGDRAPIVRKLNILKGLQSRGFSFPVGKVISGEELNRVYERALAEGAVNTAVPFEMMNKDEKIRFLKSLDDINPKRFHIKLLDKPQKKNYKDEALRRGFYKNQAGQWRKVNIKS